MRPMACALMSSALACLPAATAHADVMLDFALEVEAPAGAQCTAAKTLQGAIETRIDRLVFLDDPAPARRIRLRIEQDAATNTWSAQIVMRDERGEIVGDRRVSAEGTRCDDLDQALIVVLSTLIGIAEPAPKRAAVQPEDEAQTPRAPDPARNPAATPPADIQIVDPDVPDAPATESEPVHFELAASVAGTADFGMLPHLAPGAALGVELDFGAVTVMLGAIALPYSSLDLGLGASSSFRVLAGNASLCLDAAHFGAVLAFCAGAQAGAIDVRTAGVVSPSHRTEAVVRATLGPHLRMPLAARFGLSAELTATAPLFSPRFFLFDASGQRQYYHSIGLGIAGQLGVYWLFLS